MISRGNGRLSGKRSGGGLRRRAPGSRCTGSASAGRTGVGQFRRPKIMRRFDCWACCGGVGCSIHTPTHTAHSWDREGEVRGNVRCPPQTFSLGFPPFFDASAGYIFATPRTRTLSCTVDFPLTTYWLFPRVSAILVFMGPLALMLLAHPPARLRNRLRHSSP
jgi:hypothetical protein